MSADFCYNKTAFFLTILNATSSVNSHFSMSMNAQNVKRDMCNHANHKYFVI